MPGSFANDRSMDSRVLRVMIPIGDPRRVEDATSSPAPVFSRVRSAASASIASRTASLTPPLLGVGYPSQELQQSQPGGAPHRSPHGGEVEGVGDGERPIEIEENGRDSESS